MPHLDFMSEIAKLKGSELTEADRKEAEERAKYAKHWLETSASDEYVFKLAEDTVPEPAKNLSAVQKKALVEVLAYVEAHETLEGQELHTALHDMRQKLDIPPKEFFSGIYLSFLGKDHGPKVGWFLSVLDRKLVINRLKEVTA